MTSKRVNSARVAGLRAIVQSPVVGQQWISRTSRAPTRSSRHVGRFDLPGACAPGPITRSEERSDVLKVRGRQLAALAHDVVAELLPLAEIGHSGALDCGDVHEHVLPAIGRLNEAK